VKYSIDTSAFLDGWVRYYPPDVFPPLWRKIEGLIATTELRASIEVGEELRRKDDGVYKWTKSQNGLFSAIDLDIQFKVKEILTQFPRLVSSQSNRTTADPFVIALAQIENCIVVTGEKLTGSVNHPKIPDVCRQLNIRCMTLLEMIRNENWIFAEIQ